MELQAEGLKHNPHLMLIDDADRPAKWYFQLKAAHLEAKRTGSRDEASDVRAGDAEVEKLRRCAGLSEAEPCSRNPERFFEGPRRCVWVGTPIDRAAAQ